MQDRKRKPWLAALMSLLIPGLGQMYAGKLKRAVVILVVIYVGMVLGYLIALSTAPYGIVYTIVFWGIPGLLFVYFAVPFDAFRMAKKSQEAYELKRFNRWYFYLLHAFVASILASETANYFRTYQIEPFVTPTGSMMPTLIPGDRIYADKRIDRIVGELKRGQIVLFKAPDKEIIYVKRIVGLPGDKIAFVNGRLVINGTSAKLEKVEIGFTESLGNFVPEFFRETIDEVEYTVAYSKSPGQDVPMTVIPAGSVYVVGDNRDNSLDSRHFGPVPFSNLKGKPLQIWFSPKMACIGTLLN